MEQWKNIKGFEEFYEVSDKGRVRSKDRYYLQPGFGWRHRKGRILSPNHNGNGYLCVELRKGDGKRNRRYIHRLVAEAFIDNPKCKPQVNHLDHNRKNNNAENLEWVTCTENIRYSAHLIRHPRFSNKNTNKEYGTGIRLKDGKYEVYICHKYLGRYWELEEAQKVRDEYVKKYYDGI
jgi:hypothetical protein